MINRFNIHILILFGFLYSGIAIPDSDSKDWTVLNDGKKWVGHKDYKGFPWCRYISNLPFSCAFSRNATTVIIMDFKSNKH